MTQQAAIVDDNAAWSAGGAILSILIPFKGDDPTPLLAALGREACGVELVILDDGTGDGDLAARVAEAICALPFPARFVRLAHNEGRAKGRNRLVAHARAPRFLFLDSDMLPDGRHFLRDWLDVVARQDPPVAFGGFSLHQAPPHPGHALHRAMASHADCLTADCRARNPAKHVFTSNLLVRRDVFEDEAFDEGFAGWGWEDVEWGMRVARRWPILHVDNTATHLGLDTAPVMAAKYEQSAANFARVVAAHPAVVATYPSYKVAKVLKYAPLRGLWRPALKLYALIEGAPVKTRAFAMRLYRAALYVEAV
ncbi:glycosyltransferase family 2 protein [Phenylobacterium sp.]|uniref:polysaccharide biosynthesis protein HfsG n=1 Tax=Phenylobacterium sp. TaxID=1871053 RepID=UPI0027325735|nr:glycosyltransferase [Phenylobacterium sp.]MDP3853925.1 glycosyltransferase [Phenylobacterium sp.]